jgi:hypothetical protein
VEVEVEVEVKVEMEINKILALIGIPNYEAKQKFIYMKTDLKKLFKKNIITLLNNYCYGTTRR